MYTQKQRKRTLKHNTPKQNTLSNIFSKTTCRYANMHFESVKLKNRNGQNIERCEIKIE